MRDFSIFHPEKPAHGPQQRLLLEVTWDAIERAGICPDDLNESATGVFIGLYGHDYEDLEIKSFSNHEVLGHYSTGVSTSIAAGRLSYILGTKGPSMTIDTACSSSLVALHLACQSLHEQECRQAIVGGVNLILSPEASISFARAGMLSPDGKCKTFDRSANGYVRGEGIGVVILKPIKQALADKDTILAVIRGTAINQDGASNGLTAPNLRAQAEVLSQALQKAHIHAAEVSYLEAHGTGPL